MADDEETPAGIDTRTPEEIEEAEGLAMMEFLEPPAKKTEAERDAEAFEEFERDLAAAGMTYDEWLDGKTAE
jgi:hypothetical protein